MRHTLLILLFGLLATHGIWAQTDSAQHQSHKSLPQRIIAYFDDSNKPKQSRAFDFSVLGGPHYSSDKGLGIGLVAAGLYRHDRADSLLQPSSVSLYGDATTGRFFKVGIEGNHIFPRDKFRLQYDVNFQSFDTKYWGIGYASNVNDANETDYKYFMTDFVASLTMRLGHRLYVGPMAAFSYVKASHLQPSEIWSGLPLSTACAGVGLTLRYDTRDYITCAHRGVYLAIDQKYYPRLWDSRGFGRTDLTASYFVPAWRDAIVATMLHAELSYGDVPWTLLPTFGGSDMMRGYYEGRYRDKCAAVACVELRQHVWRRSGIVAWVGAGKVFPNFQGFNLRQLLPNYGIGYRWEFKQRVNVRLDYGFGKGCSSFVFSINEAF